MAAGDSATPPTPAGSPAARLAAKLAGAIRDERVLRAIAAVPRDRFTPPDVRDRAYENVALPIACEQTISQPIVVARMLELLELRGEERVLDVGTGSGYHAALLAQLVPRVLTIERHAELSEAAASVMRELGIENVEFFVGDGSRGIPSRGPYDAINIAAAVGARVPPALIEQLAPGGRLVAPVHVDPDEPDAQRLTVLRRAEGIVSHTVLEPVRFVPLVAGPDDRPATTDRPAPTDRPADDPRLEGGRA